MSQKDFTEEIQNLQQIKKLREEYNIWRKRANEGLPELAQRVFALRGKNYKGSGYHYNMEKTLGSMIREINDYERLGKPPYRDSGELMGDMLVTQILLEGLYEDVEAAEQSLQKPN